MKEASPLEQAPMTYEDLLAFLDDYDACEPARNWCDHYRAEHPYASVADVFDAVPHAPWRVWLHQVLNVPFTQEQADVALEAIDAFLLSEPGVLKNWREDARLAYASCFWDDVADWACFMLTHNYEETYVPELNALNSALRTFCPGVELVKYVKKAYGHAA